MQRNPEVIPSSIQPYVGPRSFQKDQRDFFFGRDDEADELVSIITAHSAVLLYSQSGAGKTSLLNAKLIPRLEEVEHFHVLRPMRVQGQIPATLRIGRRKNIFVLNALLSGPIVTSPEAKIPSTFCEFLAGCEQRTNDYGDPSPIVMIFDQFEELFTSYPGRWADREDFFAQLGEALEGNPRKGIPANPLLRVVFCMREDYIAELDPYLHLLPEKLRTRFRLEHLREKKALTAIVKPLEATNRSFAPGVAEQLVKNLLRIPSHSISGTQTLGLYVEPVQLQVVCQSLWEALRPEENVITEKHLQRYGDVSQALSNFYEKSIKAVAAETGVKEENLRRWFADTLITTEGTRAPVNRGNESTGGMPNAAVDKLEEMRLIKGEWKGTNVRWYELAHDRFIEPIRKSNERWLANLSRGEQIRLRLEAKALKWQPGSKPLDSAELLEAKRLVKNHSASPSLRALVDASHAGAQKKRIRLLGLIAAVCAVAVIVFLLVALFAWKKSKDASFAEAKANSRLLALRASDFLSSDPELSVLLAQKAIDEFADTKDARDVIRSGLLSLSSCDGALHDPGAKIVSAEFSRDGKFILTRTSEDKVKLWSSELKQIKSIDGYGAIPTATFSPDGKLIATGGADGKARLFDGSSGALIRELSGHTATINRVVFSPSGEYLVTGSDDSTARVWKVASGDELRVLYSHQAGVMALAFSPDNIHFASEAADETGRIWSIENDKSITLEGLSGKTAALAFDHEGKLLATEGGPGTILGVSLSGDYPVTVWDVRTGKSKFKLGGHRDSINSIRFSEERIVTSSSDTTARLWTTDGQLVKELRGHTKPVTSASFSTDGKYVVTSSADNTLRVWDALDGKSIATLKGHTQVVNDAAFSADGKSIVSASDDESARLWPHQWDENGMTATSRWDYPAAVTGIAWNPDGTEVAATTNDGKIWLEGIGMQRAAPLNYLIERSARISDVSFSPNGKFVATTLRSDGLIYDLTLLRQSADSMRSELIYQEAGPAKTQILSSPVIVTLTGDAGLLNSIAFSPNGNQVVTASEAGVVTVWDAVTGNVIQKLPTQTGSVNRAVFSADGNFIATAGDDKTIRLWDAHNFAEVRMIGQPHTDPVRSVEFSRDGASLVAVSGQLAFVYEVQSGNLIRQLKGHSAPVNSASFSADSQLIVTAAADNTARVWRAQTGERIATLLDNKGPVLRALFSPDGQSVLTASEDYSMRAYPRLAFAPFEEIQGLIKKRVTRPLTPEEKDIILMEPD